MVEKIRKALDLARAERARRELDDRDRPEMADDAFHPFDVEGAPAPQATEPRTAAARRVSVDPSLLEGRRILLQTSVSPAAEAFRLLRTQVMQRMAEKQWRTIAVVSPAADESRVVISTNLAAAIAADPRHHAMLVEMDLRAPRLAALFGFVPEVGAESVLAGESTPDACLVRPDGFERLTLLPARNPVARASELLTSDATRRFVGELRNRYVDRVVVYDAPPVLESDEALAFLPAVDCALLVVNEARTRRAEVSRAMHLLRRIPLVGSVLGNSSGAGTSRE